MTTGYALTESAEQDLEELLGFVADRDGLKRALRIHDRFLHVFSTLAESPHIGSTRPHLTGEVIRWHPVFRWLVIYEPDTRPLTILRVIHGARELGRLFRSEH